MLWTLITMTEPFFAFRPLQKERSPLREEKGPLRMEVLKHLREIFGSENLNTPLETVQQHYQCGQFTLWQAEPIDILSRGENFP